VAVLGIGVNFPSQLVGFLSGPAAPDGQNFAALDNPDYKRLTDQAAGTPGAPGCELWAQAEKALFQRQDVVPLSVSLVHYFGNKARFSPGYAGPEPTSLRLLAS
jgi:peptide/nickel transport system substrate-binding protein